MVRATSSEEERRGSTIFTGLYPEDTRVAAKAESILGGLSDARAGMTLWWNFVKTRKGDVGLFIFV